MLGFAKRMPDALHATMLQMKMENKLHYMQKCRLQALNTRYRKRKGKLWTHTLPCGKKSQIDYILINAKWKSSALNGEIYNNFSTVGSEHRIVAKTLRLNLRQSKSSTNKKFRYDRSKLLTDNNLKELYTVEINNRFQALQDPEENVKNSNTIYTNII